MKLESRSSLWEVKSFSSENERQVYTGFLFVKNTCGNE